MSINLDSILGEFAATEGDATRAFEAFKRIGRALGYDHAVADFSRGKAAARIAFHASTHPDKWRNEQSQLSLDQVLKDPIVHHLRSRVDPIFWSRRDYERAGLTQFYERFRDQGLGSGIALSVRGLNGETLSVGLSNSEQQETGDVIPVLQMGALYLSATAMFNRILIKAPDGELQNVESPAKLTQRELECLKWARAGKTGWEIATILGVSHGTSIFHMKNIMKKLNASNRTHAVMIAVDRGLID